MLIKNKCLNCAIIVKLFVLLLINTNCQLDEIDLQIKNIIEREKEISAEQGESFYLKSTNRYTINSQIMKYYNNNTEIYISIIDPDIRNKYSFLSHNFKENYIDSYDQILGPTQNFFPMMEGEILNTTYVKINDGEVLDFSFKNKSEILMHIIEDSNKNKFYFMRNLFFYDNYNLNEIIEICEKEKKLLKHFNSGINFYDVDLISNCPKNISNVNDNFIHEYYNLLYASKDINFQNDSKILYDYLTVENDFVKTKISRKRNLNQVLEKILGSKVKCKEFIMYLILGI